MFKGKFSFNLRNATSCNYMPQYSPAYHTTNEPIEEWLKLTPIKNPSVLTVAASGDQPLLYTAHGATHIDTFDITINACVAMDFKTTALQRMDHQDYINVVHNLTHLDHVNILKFPGMRTEYDGLIDIVENMPDRTRELMRNIILNRPLIFCRDIYGHIFPKDQTLYSKMQQTVNTPFNFIWSDLMNMPHYIKGKYDIINVSNIFDHYLWNGHTGTDIISSIQNLWPHLNTGGYMLCTTTTFEIPEILENAPTLWFDRNTEISLPATPTDSMFSPIVIQKTR